MDIHRKRKACVHLIANRGINTFTRCIQDVWELWGSQKIRRFAMSIAEKKTGEGPFN